MYLLGVHGQEIPMRKKKTMHTTEAILIVQCPRAILVECS